MANNYYSPTSIVAQTKARSSQENSDRTLVETAFDRLPTRASMDAGSVWFVTDTGAADVYAVAMQKTATSYTDGMSFTMKVANTNTGACTVNVDGLGAKAIKITNGADPVAGDLTDGDFHTLVYDADAGYFRIISLVRSVINGQASMSDAEIKAAYERNADTNAFTDDEQAKIGHISVSAPIDLDDAVTRDVNGNVSLPEEVQATCYLGTTLPLTGTTPTVDCDEANFFSITTSGNTTFSFSYAGVNLTTNDVYGFFLRVTAGGTHTLTWPGTVDWPSGVTPDAPASGETDIFYFLTENGGSTWHGVHVSDSSS